MSIAAFFFLCVCEVKKKRTNSECGQTGPKAATEVKAVSFSLSLVSHRPLLLRTHYIIHDSPSLSLAPAPLLSLLPHSKPLCSLSLDGFVLALPKTVDYSHLVGDAPSVS